MFLNINDVFQNLKKLKKKLIKIILPPPTPGSSLLVRINLIFTRLLKNKLINNSLNINKLKLKIFE